MSEDGCSPSHTQGGDISLPSMMLSPEDGGKLCDTIKQARRQPLRPRQLMRDAPTRAERLSSSSRIYK